MIIDELNANKIKQCRIITKRGFLFEVTTHATVK